MWKIVRIGIPSWLAELAFSGSRLVITPLIAAYGTAVIAAYGVGNQISHLGIMMLVGIGLGVSSLIGHNLGSDKKVRARKTGDQSILLGVGIMTAMGTLAFIFAEQIMMIFFQAPATIGYGVTMLRILAFGFPFVGVFIMLEEIHMGVGLNTPSMVMAVIHSWLFQALPIFVFTQVLDYQVTAVWWTMTTSLTVSSFLFYGYYRRGRWLTVRV
jgi:Na+-driven multidrug efflux pump